MSLLDDLRKFFKIETEHPRIIISEFKVSLSANTSMEVKYINGITDLIIIKASSLSNKREKTKVSIPIECLANLYNLCSCTINDKFRGRRFLIELGSSKTLTIEILNSIEYRFIIENSYSSNIDFYTITNNNAISNLKSNLKIMLDKHISYTGDDLKLL